MEGEMADLNGSLTNIVNFLVAAGGLGTAAMGLPPSQRRRDHRSVAGDKQAESNGNAQ